MQQHRPGIEQTPAAETRLEIHGERPNRLAGTRMPAAPLRTRTRVGVEQQDPGGAVRVVGDVERRRLLRCHGTLPFLHEEGGSLHLLAAPLTLPRVCCQVAGDNRVPRQQQAHSGRDCHRLDAEAVCCVPARASGSPCTSGRPAPPSADELEGHLEWLVDQGAKERRVQLEVLVGHPQLMDLRHRGKLGVRQGAEIVRQCLKPDIEQP